MKGGGRAPPAGEHIVEGIGGELLQAGQHVGVDRPRHPQAGGAAWQQRCYAELQTLEIPTHFVWGGADAVFPFDDAERWADAIPGATLDRIPGSGHYIQEDATQDCVAAFLARATEDSE